MGALGSRKLVSQGRPKRCVGTLGERPTLLASTNLLHLTGGLALCRGLRHDGSVTSCLLVQGALAYQLNPKLNVQRNGGSGVKGWCCGVATFERWLSIEALHR